MTTRRFAPPGARPPRLRRALQTALLALAAFLTLGTSKMLYGKRLAAPKLEPPPGARVLAPPEAWLKENVNNQGCFSKPVLDFTLRVRLQNDGTTPLSVDPRAVVLSVDGRRLPVSAAGFLQPIDHPEKMTRGPALPAGTRGQLEILASRLLPKEALGSVREVTLEIPLGPGPLRITFRGIEALPVVKSR